MARLYGISSILCTVMPLLSSKIGCHGSSMAAIKATIYSTAQRQLDTRMRAAGWVLAGEDYIMRSIFERMPVMFMPASGILSGLCTRKHYIILYELLNEYYNMNIHDELMNNVSVCSNRSLNPLFYCKATHVQYITVWPGVESGFGLENGLFIGDWISINLFASHLVGR